LTKPFIKPIQDELICLRLLTEADLPLTLSWRNQAEIRRWFLSSDMITPEQHAAWFRKYQERDNDLVFIIEETRDLRKPVGQISLYDIHPQEKTAEYGRLMIGEMDARGKGLAKAATLLVLACGFGQLGLEEIHLEVFKDNLAALRVYESVGFVACGERENLLLMRVLKRAFNYGG
jgi:diamine N-acetyltransferase